MRRRYDPDRQLTLADWSPRECRSPLHRGRRDVPVDQFVRNGPYLRTVCRACWAEAERSRRTESLRRDDGSSDCLRVNMMWRPTNTGTDWRYK